MGERTHIIDYQDFDSDADGYAPPFVGGAVNFKVGKVEYTDDGDPVLAFTLPQGAVPLFWQVNIPTAFDDTGTNLLDIGTEDDGDAFAANLDVSATGQIPNGFDPDALNVMLTVETDVYLTFAGENGNSANGVAHVTCFYGVGVGGQS